MPKVRPLRSRKCVESWQIRKPDMTFKQIIFGRWKELWHPGVVITETVDKMPVKPNHEWVFWYGEKKMSQVSYANICSFRKYLTEILANNKRDTKKFKEGIKEAIRNCVLQDLGMTISDEETLEWESKGFCLESLPNTLTSSEYDPSSSLTNKTKGADLDKLTWLLHAWKSLLVLINQGIEEINLNVTESNAKCVTMVKNAFQLLENLVESILTIPEGKPIGHVVLLMIECMVMGETALPESILNSHTYAVGSFPVMNCTPTMNLAMLLFSPAILDNKTFHERYLTVFSKLLNLGLNGLLPPWPFAKALLKKFESNLNSELFLPHLQPRLQELWVMIVNNLSGVMENHGSLSDGSDTSHGFQCIYGLLIIPISHFLNNDPTRESIKPLLKPWKKMFEIFVINAQLVINTKSSVVIEELCKKIVIVLMRANVTSSYMDHFIQFLMIIYNVSFYESYWKDFKWPAEAADHSFKGDILKLFHCSQQLLIRSFYKITDLMPIAIDNSECLDKHTNIISFLFLLFSTAIRYNFLNLVVEKGIICIDYYLKLLVENPELNANLEKEVVKLLDKFLEFLDKKIFSAKGNLQSNMDSISFLLEKLFQHPSLKIFEVTKYYWNGSMGQNCITKTNIPKSLSDVLDSALKDTSGSQAINAANKRGRPRKNVGNIEGDSPSTSSNAKRSKRKVVESVSGNPEQILDQVSSVSLTEDVTGKPVSLRLRLKQSPSGDMSSPNLGKWVIVSKRESTEKKEVKKNDEHCSTKVPCNVVPDGKDTKKMVEPEVFNSEDLVDSSQAQKNVLNSCMTKKCSVSLCRMGKIFSNEVAFIPYEGKLLKCNLSPSKDISSKPESEVRKTLLSGSTASTNLFPSPRSISGRGARFLTLAQGNKERESIEDRTAGSPSKEADSNSSVYNMEGSPLSHKKIPEFGNSTPPTKKPRCIRQMPIGNVSPEFRSLETGCVVSDGDITFHSYSPNASPGGSVIKKRKAAPESGEDSLLSISPSSKKARRVSFADPIVSKYVEFYIPESESKIKKLGVNQCLRLPSDYFPSDEVQLHEESNNIMNMKMFGEVLSKLSAQEIVKELGYINMSEEVYRELGIVINNCDVNSNLPGLPSKDHSAKEQDESNKTGPSYDLKEIPESVLCSNLKPLSLLNFRADRNDIKDIAREIPLENIIFLLKNLSAAAAASKNELLSDGCSIDKTMKDIVAQCVLSEVTNDKECVGDSVKLLLWFCKRVLSSEESMEVISSLLNEMDSSCVSEIILKKEDMLQLLENRLSPSKVLTMAINSLSQCNLSTLASSDLNKLSDVLDKGRTNEEFVNIFASKMKERLLMNINPAA